MDKIFYPDQRKWISPVTNLGKSMKQLKQLVLLRKACIPVVDPVGGAGTSGTASSGYGPGSSSGAITAGSSSDTFVLKSIKAEGGGYLPIRPNIEAEAKRLKEEVVRSRENQWNRDDEICEQAIDIVGGPKFFDPNESEEEEEDEEEYVGKGKGRKRGKGKKKRKAKKKNQEEDESMEIDEDNTLASPDPGAPSSSSAAMYEAYNNVTIKEEPEDTVEPPENDGQSEGFSKSRSQCHSENGLDGFRVVKSILIPDCLNESDNEDHLDYENDRENFASAAERYELYRTTRPDLLHSDSEESHVEANSSDDEAENVPGTGTSTRKYSSREPPPPPLPPGASLPPCVLKDWKRVTLTNIKKESFGSANDNEPEPSTSKDTSANPNIGGVPFYEFESKEQQQESIGDFKRFIDWVFDQTMKRDKESQCNLKPDLMQHLNLEERDIEHYQKMTSANLTTVKGEVFQDDQIMKSSSMPILAPPIVLPASTNLQSLAVFITHGEDPSCFPWKSINVQQQMNDDFVNNEFVERMEQQKTDLANPSMTEELVNKQNDFLVQVLIYQATDPDDVIPDEVKFREREDARGDNTVAVAHGRRKVYGRPCNSNILDSSSDSISAHRLLRRYVEPKLAYELHLLGSQTVKDLMQAIHCENDYVYLEDIPHPDSYKEDKNQLAKTRFPSSMMLIHETIYSDPNGDGKDYTSLINDWAKKRPEKQLGSFQSGNWNVPLKDLDLQFGYPYVYIHLGGCEHIFVFTKARLLHAEDHHLKEDYPKVNGMTRFKNVYCRVDNEYLARWAVLDYKEFPENPMLLCTECVRIYCYDKQKRKRGNFRLYPFTQLANII